MNILQRRERDVMLKLSPLVLMCLWITVKHHFVFLDGEMCFRRKETGQLRCLVKTDCSRLPGRIKSQQQEQLWSVGAPPLLHADWSREKSERMQAGYVITFHPVLLFQNKGKGKYTIQHHTYTEAIKELYIRQQKKTLKQILN